MTFETKFVKNNRAEHLTGPLTVDDFRPVTVAANTVTLEANHTRLVGIKDGDGNLLGYLKVFAVD